MQKGIKVNLKHKVGKIGSVVKKYGTTKNILTGVGLLSAAGLIGYGFKSMGGPKNILEQAEKAQDDYKIPVNIS